MSFWESESLRTVAGGTWLARPAPAATITGLSTDTRTLRPGQAFLALAGERFDGHRMLAEAAAKGSPLAIIDNPDALPSPAPPGLSILKVADTRRCLARLAAAYRRSLEGTKVIAVGGSNGKTTTVRLIEAVLSQGLKGTASHKSFNNDIGVPLTILAARPGDGYLICEVGTNSPGEVGRLAEIVQPDIAVITSIGREHLEQLGSIESVAREEAHLFESVRRGGAGIYSADSPELAEVIPSLPSKPATLIGFGRSEQATVRIVSATQTWDGVTFTLNDRATFRLGLLGTHNAVNAGAAVAVGRRLGLSDAQIAAGLAAAKGPEMRLERIEAAGVRILNDAYNANPDSMRAGLDTLAEVGAGASRRVAVLGDMLEMGDHSEPEHRQIGSLLAERRDLELIVLVGPAMRAAAEAITDGRAVWVPDLDEINAREVAALIRDGDLVFLKGSRRMRLERLIPAIRERVAARPAGACA
jgi:UDP-N-acetylmuramoyl-tripeptide--D-alanyl-D-alanine ligase